MRRSRPRRRNRRRRNAQTRKMSRKTQVLGVRTQKRGLAEKLKFPRIRHFTAIWRIGSSPEADPRGAIFLAMGRCVSQGRQREQRPPDFANTCAYARAETARNSPRKSP